MLATSFADHAAVVVANSDAYWTARSATESLTAAMQSRAVIEQATGIIMVAETCTADAAFQSLRRRARDGDVKVRQAAVSIVDRRAAN